MQQARSSGELFGTAAAATQSDSDYDTLPDVGLLDADAVSSVQRRLWFLRERNPQSVAENLPMSWIGSGDLDIPALSFAFENLVRRHEVLRTSPKLDNNELLLCPAAQSKPILEVIKLETVHGSLSICEDLQLRFFSERFDFPRQPLLRAQLICMPEASFVLSICTHHSAFDGWSAEILNSELGALYRNGGMDVSPPPKYQYRHFAAWHNRRINSLEVADQLRYWKDRLEGVAAPPRLPSPGSEALRSPGSSSHPRTARTERRMFAHSMGKKVAQAAARSRCTSFMFLAAAFNVLLYRYTGQRDIAIGTISAYRTRAEFESMIGCFVNPLTLRQTIDPDLPFSALLKQLRDEALNAFDHQDVPFDQVVAAVSPERSGDEHPLFKYLLIYQNIKEQALELGSVKLNLQTPAAPATSLDLTIWFEPVGTDLQCIALYDADRIAPEMLARLLDHLERVLWSVIDDPDVSASRVEFLSDAEKSTLLVEFSGLGRMPLNTLPCIGRGSELVARLEAMVELEPERPALLFGDLQMTRRELRDLSAQFSEELLRKGARAGDKILLDLERSPQAIAAIFGVLRIGAAYVPIEPGHPQQRRERILDDSSCRFAIASSGIVALEVPERSIEIKSSDERIAYVLYTSGSSGTPKGVLGTERGIINRIDWMQRFAPFSPNDCVCHKTSLAFVDSVWEIFGPLCSGASLVIASQETVLDPSRLLGLLKSRKVTHLVAVPSYLNVLCEAIAEQPLPDLKICISSGEPISATLMGRLIKKLGKTQLLNIYGSTEVAADASFAELNHRSIPSAGRPIDGCLVYILDEQLVPVPLGCIGEICIGGLGVSAGYLAPDLSGASRFLPNPFAPGRLYRSGDRGCFNDQGELEVLGRADRQVKIRGQRIELSEVDAACAALPDINGCWTECETSQDGENELVLYCSSQLNAESIRSQLRSRLPKYMLPGRIIVRSDWPINTSGKLDRMMLKRDAICSAKPESAAASQKANDALEASISEVWFEKLGRKVAFDEDFFDAGGHSLLGVRLVRSLEQTLGVAIPVSTLFENPTITAMSARLRHAVPSISTAGSMIDILREGSDPVPWVGFPPLGHTALFFKQMVSHVERGWPVAAVADIEKTDIDSFDEFARRVTADLLAKFPFGTYYLGGFCLGSHFAYEVGRRLAKEGREVVVAVVDGICPRIRTTGANRTPVGPRLLLRRVLQSIRAQGPTYLHRRIRTAWREFRDPIVGRQIKLQRRLFRMTESYLAEPGEVRIICFESQECRASRNYDTHRGWEKLAQGGFESVVFSGADHLSVTAADSTYFKEIANALSRTHSALRIPN